MDQIKGSRDLRRCNCFSALRLKNITTSKTKTGATSFGLPKVIIINIRQSL